MADELEQEIGFSRRHGEGDVVQRRAAALEIEGESAAAHDARGLCREDVARRW